MNPATRLEEARLEGDHRTLHLRFSDGATFALPSHYLRVFSPSAETGAALGRDPSLLLVPDRPVGIAAIEAVGHYALRLLFDDGHASGIYAYDFLRELGETRTERWARYERRLLDAHRATHTEGDPPHEPTGH